MKHMKKKRATMEAVERSHPHQSRSSSGGAGDFFICFSARPSSSSVTCTASTTKRVSSTKSLMSPGRGRDPSSVPALSASLSRRLRSSGSVKGGQSPMFPSGVPLAGRKKGCAFEAAEPSSPKVTCIGQVRVKAKKKVKSTAMARSRSRRGRECCPGRNQSWVHQLPVSICEALRGIGSDFNCFVPCGGRTEKDKGIGETRMVRSASSSSCGAVVAKWLLAVQENEEEVKGREKVEVGFLVREREEKVEIEEMGSMGGEKGEGGEEAAARVSVCIPPRNALLLMRCRSDPVKMAALASRFWGSPVSRPLCEEERVEEEYKEVEEEIEKHGNKHKIEENGENPLVDKEEGDAVEVSGVAGELVKGVDCKKTTEEENRLIAEEEQPIEEKGIAREEFSCGPSYVLQVKPPEGEAKDVANEVQNQEKKAVGNKSLYLTEREEEKEGMRVMEERRFGTIIASRSKERGSRRWKEKDTRRHSLSSELDARRHSFSSEREAKRASFSIDKERRWSFSLEKADLEPNDHIKSLTFSATEASPEEEKKKEVTPEEEEEEEEEETEATGEAESGELATAEGKHEAEVEEEKKGEAREWTELPDCLLMMMYEPKLSMEVSKETWVCGNDFVRWRPQHTRNRIPPNLAVIGKASDDNAAHPQLEAKQAEAAATVVLMAPRPDPSKSTAVQHKLSARPATVAPYEPLVLTRCKSEPVRSSARLAPDACFWKDRHRPIGAAGIGF